MKLPNTVMQTVAGVVVIIKTISCSLLHDMLGHCQLLVTIGTTNRQTLIFILQITKKGKASASSVNLIPTPSPFLETECYINRETHQPTHTDPEDGGSIYLRNVSNIAHNQCYNTRTELTSIINYRKDLKSVRKDTLCKMFRP
jgi:hypothetical protein